MKLRIEEYKAKHKQRNFLACQENRRSYWTSIQTRYRIMLGKTTLMEGIVSHSMAEAALSALWTAEGFTKALSDADEAYFNTVKEAAEARKQTVERILKRMKLLDAAEKANLRPNRRRSSR